MRGHLHHLLSVVSVSAKRDKNGVIVTESRQKTGGVGDIVRVKIEWQIDDVSTYSWRILSLASRSNNLAPFFSSIL